MSSRGHVEALLVGRAVQKALMQRFNVHDSLNDTLKQVAFLCRPPKLVSGGAM